MVSQATPSLDRSQSNIPVKTLLYTATRLNSLRLYGQKLCMPPLLAPNVRVKHGGLQTFIPREHDSCSRCVQDECKKFLCHVTRYGRELKRTKGEDVVEGRKRVEQKGCER